MSRTSEWHTQSSWGESLHSSEVFSVCEPKFCEDCGVLFVRLRESKIRFCPDCHQLVLLASRRTQ